MTIQNITGDDIAAIRYALKELANRRRELAIDTKQDHWRESANKIDALENKIAEQCGLGIPNISKP